MFMSGIQALQPAIDLQGLDRMYFMTVPPHLAALHPRHVADVDLMPKHHSLHPSARKCLETRGFQKHGSRLGPQVMEPLNAEEMRAIPGCKETRL